MSIVSSPQPLQIQHNVSRRRPVGKTGVRFRPLLSNSRMICPISARGAIYLLSRFVHLSWSSLMRLANLARMHSSRLPLRWFEPNRCFAKFSLCPAPSLLKWTSFVSRAESRIRPYTDQHFLVGHGRDPGSLCHDARQVAISQRPSLSGGEYETSAAKPGAKYHLSRFRLILVPSFAPNCPFRSAQLVSNLPG